MKLKLGVQGLIDTEYCNGVSGMVTHVRNVQGFLQCLNL